MSEELEHQIPPEQDEPFDALANAIGGVIDELKAENKRLRAEIDFMRNGETCPGFADVMILLVTSLLRIQMHCQAFDLRKYGYSGKPELRGRYLSVKPSLPS